MSKKIAVVIGTRPEIIKMSPVIKELERTGMDHYVVHSGQHYSYSLDRIFFENLGLAKPRYRLEVGSGSPAGQTAQITARTGIVLARNRPDIVLVQGDTNTVLGAAIAASKLGIPVGHVEAGLRSYDRTMPEELNRILADHCSDYLFAPTPESRQILLSEGIPGKRIHMTGNTIVDAIMQNKTRAVPYPEKDYILASVHRQENVDDPARFASIAKSLAMISDRLGIPVVYPIHPRSKKMARKFGISFGPVRVVQPVDYFAFLGMESGARLVMTDSGGVQEEACILGVPCVTLRDNTERPETVSAGSNMVAGTTPGRILRCVRTMMKRKRNWQNPFGDGRAARRMVRILAK